MSNKTVAVEQDWKQHGKTIYRDDTTKEKGWTAVATAVSVDVAAQIVAGQKALKLLGSILSDLQTKHRPLRLEEFESPDIDSGAFFGDFNEYFSNAEESLAVESGGVRVHWPSLHLLMEEIVDLFVR
jgi:hypothetical protein